MIVAPQIASSPRSPANSRQSRRDVLLRSGLPEASLRPPLGASAPTAIGARVRPRSPAKTRQSGRDVLLRSGPPEASLRPPLGGSAPTAIGAAPASARDLPRTPANAGETFCSAPACRRHRCVRPLKGQPLRQSEPRPRPPAISRENPPKRTRRSAPLPPAGGIVASAPWRVSPYGNRSRARVRLQSPANSRQSRRDVLLRSGLPEAPLRPPLGGSALRQSEPASSRDLPRKPAKANAGTPAGPEGGARNLAQRRGDAERSRRRWIARWKLACSASLRLCARIFLSPPASNVRKNQL
jgi:hypothetical protein